MTNFHQPLLDYWHSAFAGDSNSTWTVSETLNPKRPAMMLEWDDGSVRTVLRPELVDRLGSGAVDVTSIFDIRDRLACGGISLHDPDYLFYLPADTHVVPDQSAAARPLTIDDRAAFEAFQADASEQDRDDAFVELDHWAVFGCFDGGRLVSAASAYPWEGGPFADWACSRSPMSGEEVTHARSSWRSAISRAERVTSHSIAASSTILHPSPSRDRAVSRCWASG